MIWQDGALLLTETGIFYELFTYMALEKMALPCMILFLNLLIWPPSMVFRPFLLFGGVKSRVKIPFCPWRKKNKL
jgi:hypothetical protein